MNTAQFVFPRHRRRPIAAATVFTLLLLSGCGVQSWFGSGAGSAADDDTTSAEPTAASLPTLTQEEPEPEKTPEVAAEPVPETDSTSSDGPDENTPGDVDAGTVELSIEMGGRERVFAYRADHCFVSDEYMLVNGVGTEVATGAASEVGIGTSRAELLHERTGTFQADGVISFTTSKEEFVTDGRMITIEGNTIPSAFTYRNDHNSAHFVVAWFSGSAKVGAGYVEINCNY